MNVSYGLELEWTMDGLLKQYDYAMSFKDPRTTDWFLIWGSPIPVTLVCVTYVLSVVLGKKYMQNRQEMYIPEFIMIAYNIGLVALSLYMLEELTIGAYQSNYNLLCTPHRVTSNKSDVKVTEALWLYFISKAIEFLDTFFMVARKKFNQVTFLHVFHHSSMLFLWWFVITFSASGNSFFGASINCFVHAVMYLYYGLAVIPSLKDKLWWKKYITKLQLSQFVLTFIHTAQGLVFNCDYSKIGQYGLLIYLVIMMTLFLNFYRHEYNLKENKRKKTNDNFLNGKQSSNGHNHNHHHHHHINNNNNVKSNGQANLYTNGIINGNGYHHNQNGHSDKQAEENNKKDD